MIVYVLESGMDEFYGTSKMFVENYVFSTRQLAEEALSKYNDDDVKIIEVKI